MAWTVAIGIDTHKDVHAAVALDRLGAVRGSITLSADHQGYLRLWQWASELGEPAFAIEGAGSYGAGLARLLVAAGAAVYECERPRRAERRRGKSDLIDATLAAQRLLSGAPLARLRGEGVREDLRLLLLERRGAVRARTAALNQLQALIVTAPEALRARFRGLAGEQLVAAAGRPARAAGGEHGPAMGPAAPRPARPRAHAGDRRARLAAGGDRHPARARATPREWYRACLRRPARRLQRRPDPDAERGLLCRPRQDESSRGLERTSPAPPLEPGRDRQLNRALHVISLNRVRWHPETAAYHQKLLASGKTPREARRCVKRMLARYFHRRLLEIPASALTP